LVAQRLEIQCRCKQGISLRATRLRPLISSLNMHPKRGSLPVLQSHTNAFAALGLNASVFNGVACHSACNIGSDAILVKLRLFRAD
jgi:hypothetical protein